MRSKIKITGGVLGLVAVMSASAAFALSAGADSSARASLTAASSVTVPPAVTRGCVVGPNRTIMDGFENPTGFDNCKKTGGFAVALGGQTGPKGATGPQGATGPAGPSGVVATGVQALTAGSVPTGGSFNAKAVEVGSIDLAAGTYLVGLKAQVEPSADSASGVNAQFFLYDQVKNASFAGDLLNIGTDVAPAGTSHDAYASGFTLVTLSEDTTLIVYGFGYDNDSGASDFTLISGPSSQVDAVRITPAS
jgi:hypothetical protein